MPFTAGFGGCGGADTGAGGAGPAGGGFVALVDALAMGWDVAPFIVFVFVGTGMHNLDRNETKLRRGMLVGRIEAGLKV